MVAELTTGDRLAALLESRLDSVLYRAGFVHSFREARQQILHGAVLVDGRTTVRPSTQLQPGALVTLAPTQMPAARATAEAFGKRGLLSYPSHLEVDYSSMRILYSFRPKVAELFYPFAVNFSLIFRFFTP